MVLHIEIKNIAKGFQEGKMHTINLQIQDDIYESIVEKGLDINTKLKEFIYSLVDDNHLTISEKEANRRVSEAVKRYEKGTGEYVNQEQYNIYANKLRDKLIDKYDNN